MDKLTTSVDFSCPKADAPQHYTMWDNRYGTANQLDDNSKVSVDANGRVVQAEYADGSKVVRHWSYVLVSSSKGQYWFGNDQGQWFIID